MDAVEGGHTDVVRVLLEAQSDNDLRNFTLIQASRKGQVDIVRLLLDTEVDPDFADVAERTALIKASEEGQVEIVCCALASSRRES